MARVARLRRAPRPSGSARAPAVGLAASLAIAVVAGLTVVPGAGGQEGTPAPTQAATPAPARTPTPRGREDDGGGSAASFVATLLVGAAGGAAAVVLLQGRRARRHPRVSGPRRAEPPSARERKPATPGEPSAPTPQLVAACIRVADEVGSAALRDELHEGLATAGVEPVRAEGRRFDPHRHRATGTEPTDDPAKDGLVAATLRVGWVAGERQVRKPDVLVYRYAGRPPPG